jgi:hypothetical protein
MILLHVSDAKLDFASGYALIFNGWNVMVIIFLVRLYVIYLVMESVEQIRNLRMFCWHNLLGYD